MLIVGEVVVLELKQQDLVLEDQQDLQLTLEQQRPMMVQAGLKLVILLLLPDLIQ